jgi:predicted PurR-regulated permease PerM
MENKKIEISTMSIIKFICIILSFWLLYAIRDVLIILFIVIIIFTAIDPTIVALEKYKINRVLSTSIIYITIIALISLVVYSIFPPLIIEIKNLATTLPVYSSKFNIIYHFIIDTRAQWQGSIETIINQLSQFTGGIYLTTISIFGGIASTLTVLVLSFYMLADKKNLGEFLLNFIPQKNKNVLIDASSKIAIKLGNWLSGQIVISVIMGISVFIVLSILKVPFALTIALVATVMEIVPIIGPIVTGSLAILVSLLYGSWITALIVLVVFILIQQVEGHFLVPKVMSKAVGLSPVIIITALLIGGTLGGIIGAILSLPISAAIIVIVKEVQKI